jgi:quinol monooxygenase YgiN
MTEIVVIARMRAVSGKRDQLLEAISGPITESQSQDGCTRLVAHFDADDPDGVTLIEWWKSREIFEAHFELPHMKALPTRTAGVLDGAPQVQVLEALSVGDDVKGGYAELAR